MKKLCIFDLDGTLSNTLPTIAYYGNLALEKYGHEPICEERYKILVGNGRDVLIHRMLSERGCDVPAEYDRVGAAYDAAYEADVMYLTRPYDGIVELLSALHDAGIKIAVLSNKPDNVAQGVVKNLFGDIFDAVWGKKDSYPTKPDPTAAFEICRELGVTAEETVFIGDTSVDIETGKRGGFFSIGVLWGFRPEKELKDAGADALAASPGDIEKIIFENEK